MKYIENINHLKLYFLITLFFLFIYLFNFKIVSKKKVGVINLPNMNNVGNILVKFAMFKKLEKLGVNATIIIPKYRLQNFEPNISFLNRTIKSHLFLANVNFSDLNENDYDYLMINSDQTWAFYMSPFFYNVALLKFAEKWKINKFIYAASMGVFEWNFQKKDDDLFTNLLKNFTGISFRENGTVDILEKHLGLKSVFVLDPTFLIDKQYYTNEISEYKSNFTKEEKFIFVYQLDKNLILENIIEEAKKKLNLKIYFLHLENGDYIESFIYGISNCQAVITDSYHGTVFSIIFKKPFISFVNYNRGKDRFFSLMQIFDIEERIIWPTKYSNISINLLLEPLKFNETKFNKIKDFSNNYLLKNLDLIKKKLF
jgi:polysaccharide pyruvyl transferase WcaK-like protein